MLWTKKTFVIHVWWNKKNRSKFYFVSSSVHTISISIVSMHHSKCSGCFGCEEEEPKRWESTQYFILLSKIWFDRIPREIDFLGSLLLNVQTLIYEMVVSAAIRPSSLSGLNFKFHFRWEFYRNPHPMLSVLCVFCILTVFHEAKNRRSH